MPKQVTLTELTTMFDESVQNKIQALAKKARKEPSAALVVFECLALDSSHLGERTCVLVGPGHRIDSLERALGGHLKDLPSERQYPIAWWRPTCET